MPIMSGCFWGGCVDWFLESCEVSESGSDTGVDAGDALRLECY